MEESELQQEVTSMLEEVVTLYRQRNFTQTRRLTDELLSKPQKSLLAEWILENNKLSAEFHLSDTDQRDSYSLKFYKLLKKSRSLPPSVVSVGLELAVLYNGLQSNRPGVKCSQQWETTLRNTLTRVLDTRGAGSSERNDTICSLLQELCDKDCLGTDLLPVCLVWVLGLVQTHRWTDAAKILILVTSVNRSSSTYDKLSSYVVRIHESCPPLSMTSNFDLCVILLAVLYVEERKYSLSGELARRVSTNKYLSTSVYIQVLCLVQESKHTEALNTIQQLDISFLHQSSLGIQARLHCLTGQCLAMQGKPRTALLHQKAALEKDFSYSNPLYYISELYRELHMDTAQLESLNLLTTALSTNQGDSQRNKCYTLEDEVMSVVIDTVDRRERLTSVEVQSLLAATCLHLHRYEDAFEHYMDLLAVVIETDFIQTEGRLICFPELPQIFLNVATASLKSGRLEECITLCDQAIMSHTDQLSPCNSQLSPPQPDSSDVNQQSSITSGGKRKRKSSSVDKEDNHRTPESYLVKYLLLKADALQRQHKLQEALTVLQSVVEKLENMDLVESAETTDTHPGKRARLASDVSECSELTGKPLLSSVYSRLGQVSSLLNKPAQAIHYYRLALLLNPDDRNTVYHLTKSLLSVNRVQEAVLYWSEIREISTKIDTFQINRELQHRETLIKKKRCTDQGIQEDHKPSDDDLLKIDIVVLKALLNHKHTKLWAV